MRVAVLYNQPEKGKPDSEDVVRQLEFVLDTLAGNGHGASPVLFANGIEGVATLTRELSRFRPDIVFNLVEAVGDDPADHPAAAALLDVMNIAYTGSPYEALVTTTNKLTAKAVLRASGIATPAWSVYEGDSEFPSTMLPCIAKPVREDASVGIHDSSVFSDKEMLKKGLRKMFLHYGPLLVEEFIDGREFNISLLEDGQGRVEVLPPAEIVFSNWPHAKPRIINYSAKWDRDAFEYHNTVREFPSVQDPVLGAVSGIALRCWKRFGLRGYARVDMRVDAGGRVHVIEVNTNPCISPDAGFMAAAEHASISPDVVMERILTAAVLSSPQKATL